MIPDIDQDGRRSALDQFTSRAESESGQELVPINQGLPTQVFGAQAVAVKRDERAVLGKIRALAAAASSDWFYRFPVKNRTKGSTDYIEGPSVKLANDLARLYGNCDVDCRATDIGSHIVFSARFIDLETGFGLTRPFQQRKSVSKGWAGDQGRQEDILFQIGASKAIRNVIVNALQTFADYALDEAKGALVERIGSDLEKWRARTIERAEQHIDIHRIEAVIGRPSAEWMAADVARVIAMMKAVTDGMSSLDESFPPLREAPGSKSVGKEAAAGAAGATLDEFVSSSAGPTDPGSPPLPDSAAGQAGPDHPTPTASGPATTMPDLRLEAAEKALALAQHKDKPREELLTEIDALEPMLEDRLPEQHHGFIQTVLRTARDVVQGRVDPPDALRYLKGLIK